MGVTASEGEGKHSYRHRQTSAASRPRIQPGAAQVQPQLSQQAQQPKAPCSTREMGIVRRRAGGTTGGCSRRSEELPPWTNCQASSEPIQPVPANCQPRDTFATKGNSPRPPVSRMEGQCSDVPLAKSGFCWGPPTQDTGRWLENISISWRWRDVIQ